MPSSAAVLVIANLVPLIGVLTGASSIGSIMCTFWLENVVIGFFNVMRMSRVSGKAAEAVIVSGDGVVDGTHRGGLIAFFFLHYGIFATVHGVFILTLFGKNLSAAAIGLGLISLTVSHGISYVNNFIGKKEYEHTSINALMFQPYIRVVLLHIVLFLGAFLVLTLGNPSGAILVLILVKIIIDVKLHKNEHTRLQNLPFVRNEGDTHVV